MIHKLVLFGATGSIGTSTLNVIRRNKEQFKIIGLSCCSNFTKLAVIAKEFDVKNIGIWDAETFHSKNAKSLFLPGTTFFEGTEGICELAQSLEADAIIMAIPGVNGILPTLSAIKAKKTIMLASKEVLVAAGKIIINEAQNNNVEILPIDSEHNAIFQCLRNERQFLKKVILTASGGPFLNYTYQQMSKITVEEALKHPTWQMGPKITIDSSTMANKGFEIIEAKWLFNLLPENIEVVIHPESVVHSMVEFCDGSIIAQLNPHSMEYPISNCLFYPHRAHNNPESIDFSQAFSLKFSSPNHNQFPCLQIAKDCLKHDNFSAAIFLAADEVAVKAFLNKQISYNDIAKIIINTLNTYNPTYKNSIDGTLNVIQEAQYIAQTYINKNITKM